MSLPKDASYSQKPQQEICRVKGAGCTLIPTVRIYCKTEGRAILSCNACYLSWRERVRAQLAEACLEDRCPSCADWKPNIAPSSAPLPVLPLAGIAADAIDAAMHAEGLLVDVRRHVLMRLAIDAPWLAHAKSQEELLDMIKADLADMRHPLCRPRPESLGKLSTGMPREGHVVQFWVAVIPRF